MSGPIPSPTQKPTKLFPPWRLRDSISIVEDHELEASSDSCERWMWGSGSLVIIGLVAEVLIAALHPPYDSWWDRWGSTVSDFLVAVGVSGEIIFNGMVHRRDKELDRRSKVKLGEANERAALSLENVEKIKSITAWRKLTEEEKSSIRLSLNSSGQPASLKIVLTSNDPESRYYAQYMLMAFRSAGWQVGFIFNSYYDGVFPGIMIPPEYDNWLDEMKIVNSRVRDAIISAKLPFMIGWPEGEYAKHDRSTSLPTPFAWMYIGPKPITTL